MKFYFAPLESLTVASFRKVFSSITDKVDRYFIPFLQPMEDGRLARKGELEIALENNIDVNKLVPQILSKNADETLACIHKLKGLGYDEVNLNFGCPSGTVTSKNKGSGIFRDLIAMEDYLTKVFASSPLAISIKTRIGFASDDEWDAILAIYNKFPIKELIIHPRTGKEVYSGPLHLDILDGLDKKTSIPIVYNGEVKSPNDIEFIKNRFPYIQGIMIGRGFFEAPDLLEDELSEEQRKNLLSLYIDKVYEECLSSRPWGNAIHPIKAMWNYLADRFEGSEKLKKKMMKATRQDDFFAYARRMFVLPLKNPIPDGIWRYSISFYR